MKILVHSHIAPEAVLSNLGEVEYSYGLVLREFSPVLAKAGNVAFIADPARADGAILPGENTVFLSFSPPHLTRVATGPATIAVFAWEFDTIPTDRWYDDPLNDWRTTLERCGGAIVHSSLTVAAVKAAMGEDYPVIALPAPVWDRMEAARARPKSPSTATHRLTVGRGVILDTHDPRIGEVWPSRDLVTQVLNDRDVEARTGRPPPAKGDNSSWPVIARHFEAWRRAVLKRPKASSTPEVYADRQRFADAAPTAKLWELRPREVALSGVIFTAVFNPLDGRKNWSDMLMAFCEACGDKPDATLVFKLSHTTFHKPMCDIMMNLARLPQFRCRIVLIHGVLDDAAYASLVGATHFVVNASYGEGQCLPLMEFMSAGAPAIAPDGSGMAGYIDEDVAFVVGSWLDATAWPHDPRIAYRTLRHQIDWTSLVGAFASAYGLASKDPEGYAAMSRRAIDRLRAYCSRAVVEAPLTAFLAKIADRP